mmetsp:Transcript_9262/g.28084  ORF Transcript_9262/g.28084 Transcript_9262/m.28084 type:complete len:107 (-) Transcript_9262:8-328(-)
MPGMATRTPLMATAVGDTRLAGWAPISPMRGRSSRLAVKGGRASEMHCYSTANCDAVPGKPRCGAALRKGHICGHGDLDGPCCRTLPPCCPTLASTFFMLDINKFC